MDSFLSINLKRSPSNLQLFASWPADCSIQTVLDTMRSAQKADQQRMTHRRRQRQIEYWQPHSRANLSGPPLSGPSLPLLKNFGHRESRNFRTFLPPRGTIILCALVSPLSLRFRSRASLTLSATSDRRLAAATPSSASVPFRQPSTWVYLPRVAAAPRRLGTHQIGDGDQMASQRLPSYRRWRSRSPGRSKTSNQVRDVKPGVGGDRLAMTERDLRTKQRRW